MYSQSVKAKAVSFRGLSLRLQEGEVCHIDDPGSFMRDFSSCLRAEGELPATPQFPGMTAVALRRFDPELLVGRFSETFSAQKGEELRLAAELWRIRDQIEECDDARLALRNEELQLHAAQASAIAELERRPRYWVRRSAALPLRALPAATEQVAALRQAAAVSGVRALFSPPSRAGQMRSGGDGQVGGPWEGPTEAEELAWADLVVLSSASHQRATARASDGTPLAGGAAGAGGGTGHTKRGADGAVWTCWALLVVHPSSGRVAAVVSALRKYPPPPPADAEQSFERVDFVGVAESAERAAAVAVDPSLIPAVE